MKTFEVTVRERRMGRQRLSGRPMPSRRGALRAGARRAARAAREETVSRITQRNQGELLSAADSIDKRRAHAESRIASARDPWAKFLKTAEWLASELKHQALRDPEAARKSAESLAQQTRSFAVKLNKQAREAL
ncbi:hypothetical protein [Nonomuraea wenchangensis]|uniref:hypothetical protein n=1 Tax=Nonomuraea wenchangensis TaxID=568860 RepID=UPI00331BB522